MIITSGLPQKIDLSTVTEFMRSINLYLGEAIGCVLIVIAAYTQTSYSYFILAGIMALPCLTSALLVPNPILDEFSLPGEQGSVVAGSGVPLLAKERTPPSNAPPSHLFFHFSWNTAVLSIFFPSMFSTIFLASVGSDQIINLDMSEVNLLIIHPHKIIQFPSLNVSFLLHFFSLPLLALAFY